MPKTPRVRKTKVLLTGDSDATMLVDEAADPAPVQVPALAIVVETRETPVTVAVHHDQAGETDPSLSDKGAQSGQFGGVLVLEDPEGMLQPAEAVHGRDALFELIASDLLLAHLEGAREVHRDLACRRNIALDAHETVLLEIVQRRARECRDLDRELVGVADHRRGVDDLTHLCECEVRVDRRAARAAEHPARRARHPVETLDLVSGWREQLHNCLL